VEENMIAELDTVVLTHPVPECGLTAGDVGAVVHAYPNAAYEVEFVTAGGETVAVLTLRAADIRQLLPSEILHAREITAGLP
jgi:hypothetical protein